MQSAKSGVSRVLGLPTRLISMPEAYIRSCHVLTVTPSTSISPKDQNSLWRLVGTASIGGAEDRSSFGWQIPLSKREDVIANPPTYMGRGSPNHAKPCSAEF
jgi:hypothetical protein